MDRYRKANGERSYSYYCDLDGNPRPFKKHRILPLPEDQGTSELLWIYKMYRNINTLICVFWCPANSCVAHTSVNCLEARIRRKQREEDRNNTPRLSIQHCVDNCMDPDPKVDLGLTAKKYPFVGGIHPNQFDRVNSIKPSL